jgi:hypothetical protein
MLWLSGFFMIVLVVYAGICLAFYFLQERLLFIPFFASEKRLKRLHVNTREFIIPTAEDGQIHALLLRANGPKDWFSTCMAIRAELGVGNLKLRKFVCWASMFL